MALPSKTVLYSRKQGPPTFFQWIQSILLSLIFLLSWCIGSFLPFITIGLAFSGQYTWAISFATLTVLPLVMHVDIIPWLRRIFTTTGPLYFKSYTISFEDHASILELTAADRQKKASPNPVLFCVHPHGIYCWGLVLMSLQPEFIRVRILMAKLLYRAPLFNFLVRGITCGGSASRGSFVRRLKAGEVMAILPGGFEEASVTEIRKERLFLKNRKGFVKIGLREGATLVPVYTFGESDLYYNVQGGWSFRLWLGRHSIPGVLAFGAWFCPLLPRTNLELHTVVGKPFVLPKIAEPTQAQVDQYHASYIKELQRMFDEHKRNIKGMENRQLEFW
eukprot:jgi/Mesvir1/1566/Mv25486-RA.1